MKLGLIVPPGPKAAGFRNVSPPSDDYVNYKPPEPVPPHPLEKFAFDKNDDDSGIIVALFLVSRPMTDLAQHGLEPDMPSKWAEHENLWLHPVVDTWLEFNKAIP